MPCGSATERVSLFAGAYRPLYWLHQGQLSIINGDRRPVGGGHQTEDRHFTTHRLAYTAGDRIYLFSDGYVDQFGGPERKAIHDFAVGDLLAKYGPLIEGTGRVTGPRFLGLERGRGANGRYLYARACRLNSGSGSNQPPIFGLTVEKWPSKARMVTKAELIERLEGAVAMEDVEAASEAVEGVKEAYEALIAASNEHSSDESSEDEDASDNASGDTTPVAIESAPLTDEEDKRFKQLLDSFNQRINDIRRKKAKEEADNLATKKAIMDELKSLIAGEENIGTAFQRFAELQEQWKTIGPIPQQHYRDLQNDYSHLRDEFFYHIRIYKELRDHDLRKNTALKQALISDVESLAQKDNVKELEQGVKEYQEKWHQVGPVVREEWEEGSRDRFSTATRTIYDKVHEYYKARRTEHEANLQAKQALVEKVKLVTAELNATTTKEWTAFTDQVLELQNAWKAI